MAKEKTARGWKNRSATIRDSADQAEEFKKWA
jgi:hypothetical protein